MRSSVKTDLTGFRQNLSLLILAIIYWVLALLNPWDLYGAAAEAVYYVQNLAWLAFVLVHGSRRYGWDALFVFFTITFLVSWSAEAASIATGLPFGQYHYTEFFGPKIGPVPMAVMPAYFVAGYLAWTMSTVFLANLGTGMERRNLFLVPLVASFLMVMWDFCLDPIRSTIDGAWVWHDGGFYLGVPISNFLGWFFTTLVILELFALYLYRFSSNDPFPQNKVYWSLAPIMYLGLGVEFLLNPFFHSTNLDIYWSVFLACIFTMVFASILNIIHVSRLGTERL